MESKSVLLLVARCQKIKENKTNQQASKQKKNEKHTQTKCVVHKTPTY